jgi:hypothetical protein
MEISAPLTKVNFHLWICFLMVAVCLTLSGCARRKIEPPATPVIFPLPPAKPRVQYLGSISSTDDLPRSRSAFAEFILGPEPTTYPMAKPINALLRDDRLYVCDTVFNTVIIYDLVTGKAHRLAGDRGIGKILQPNNLDFDEEGRLYVADKVRKAVLVYNADESFHDAWGRPAEIQPVDVAVGGDEIFVCGSDNHTIEVWNRQDGTLLRRFGKLGTAPGEYFIPTYLALDGQGHLLVTDTGNFRVQKVTLEGEPVDVIGGPGTTLGRFAWPKGMSVDAQGRLYVADSRFANVQVFDNQGRLLLFFGAPGPEGGNLDLPAGVRVMPWPSTPWLQERLMPGFDPESLAIVVNQQGWNFVNFFAIARDTDTTE